jgi:hypothetical protein
MQSLEELLSQARGRREEIRVFEPKPPRELVASKDILRRDGLGRTVVACPAGQSPAAWLELTADERRSLVSPAPPLPDGTLIPGAGGFTPVNTRVGFTIERTDA